MSSALDLVTSNWVADGNFPDIGPNPLLEENRREIIAEIAARRRRELSIAWDGDADRCFFIDEHRDSSTATSSPPCWPSRS